MSLSLFFKSLCSQNVSCGKIQISDMGAIHTHIYSAFGGLTQTLYKNK